MVYPIPSLFHALLNSIMWVVLLSAQSFPPTILFSRWAIHKIRKKEDPQCWLFYWLCYYLLACSCSIITPRIRCVYLSIFGDSPPQPALFLPILWIHKSLHLFVSPHFTPSLLFWSKSRNILSWLSVPTFQYVFVYPHFETVLPCQYFFSWGYINHCISLWADTLLHISPIPKQEQTLFLVD